MSYGPTGRAPSAGILVGLLTAFFAAPLTAMVPREAPIDLESHALQLILGMERQAAPGCLIPNHLETEPSRLEGTSSDAWQERWFIDRCGTLVVYDVRYVPSGRGSVDLAVALAEAHEVATPRDVSPAWVEPSPDSDPSLPGAGRTFLVTQTGDSGPGSLTQAILDANAAPNRAGLDTILFDIPGSGPRIISLIAPLPALTEPVLIDGYSQPGAHPASSSEGGTAEVLVEIDGRGLDRFAHGLLLRGGSSTIRGLRIHGFRGDAIRIEKNGSNHIEGNVLVEDEPGPSEGSGVAIIDASQNRIGGALPAARNVIEGHGGSGVSISGVGSVGNAVLGNRILHNALDGIDLDGGTSEPSAPPDARSNHGQKPPLLTSTSFVPARDGREAEVVVEGRLEADAGTSYRVELYATSAEETLAQHPCQGERFLASIEMAAGLDGRAGFQFHLPQGVRSRDLLTATATAGGGDTSEFSEPLLAPTITRTWNAGTGNWGTPGNWSPPQVPALGDDVVIAANGVNTSFTVTLDVAASINALTLGGGSGTQTLAIAAQTLTLGGASTVTSNGALQMSGGTLAGSGSLAIGGSLAWSGGIMTGAGTTTVNGPFNLSGLVGIQNGRTLNNATTCAWTSGAGQGIWTGTGSVINNSGTWDTQVDGGAIVNHYGGATTFNNSGTFKKSAGPGSTFVQIPFITTGTVDAQSGTIELSGGGSSTNVLRASLASSTLLFSGGTFDLNAGTSISGPGTILINSGGTLNVNAALTVPAGTTFSFQAGTIAGTGTLTTNGTFNWSGGIMTGAGITTVNGPFNLSGLVGILNGRTLNNATTCAWTSGAGQGMWTGTGSVINNSGTWDAQVDGGAIVNHYGGATTFNNSGTFKKSAGSGSTFMAVPFTTTGTVDVQSGTLNLQADGSNSNLLKVSGVSSTLLFSIGTFNLNAGTAISGPGTILLNSSGTLNVNAALAIPATTTFTFSAGTLAGSATLTTNGTFNWSGGLMTGTGITTANGPFNLSGLVGILNGRTLNSGATCSWTSGAGQGMWTGTGSVINNSGTWDAQVDGGAIVNHYGGATTFNNSGTFTKSAGAGSTSVSIPFTTTGTVDARSGTLNMSSSSYTQTAGTTRLSGGALTSTTTITIQGGTLAGSGTVTAPVVISGSGALAPGASPGTLNVVGNYTQQAPNAAFNVELGGTTPGTQFDRANVSGTGVATLAGPLNVNMIGGFVPAPGDSFTILTYVSHSGTFNPVFPTFPCSGWRVSYGSTALVLTFVALPTEVSSLIFTSHTGLAWDPGIIGPPLGYDVLRGMLDHQPVSTGGGQICLASGISTQSTSDATAPVPGAGFWYLVRERRTGCGIGTYGYARNGVERTSTACP